MFVHPGNRVLFFIVLSHYSDSDSEKITQFGLKEGITSHIPNQIFQGLTSQFYQLI